LFGLRSHIILLCGERGYAQLALGMRRIHWSRRQNPPRAYFFLIVSTVVVLGRPLASLTVTNSPLFASRPILKVPPFFDIQITPFQAG
jgi:hypothetical protein